MIERLQVLSGLLDDKTIRLLKEMLIAKDIIYLRELSRLSGVSLATTYRISQRLLEMGLIAKEMRGKLASYKIIKGTPLFNELYSLVIGEQIDPLKMLKEELKKKYADKASTFLLKGKQNKIFLIGNEINSDFVSLLVKDIEDKTGAKLDTLIVTPSQFKQMQGMGLVPDA